MTTATVLKPLTVDDYLTAKRDVGIRREYLNGELVAMAGGSRAYNLLTARGCHLSRVSRDALQADRKEITLGAPASCRLSYHLSI